MLIWSEAAKGRHMVAPVVPNQFEVGKNKIGRKPTKATLASTQAIPPSRASIGDVRVISTGQDYRKDDVIRVAQQLLSKLPR